MRTIVLPGLAIAGIALAIAYVSVTSKPTPVPTPAADPPEAPFRHFVAGAGIIEARTENISIGTPVAGLVMEVFVEIGSAVQKGDPLFKLDTRDLEAEVGVRRTSLRLVQERLARLKAMPRAEEVAPMQARVNEAEAFLEQTKELLKLMENVTDKRAVSVDDMTRRKFSVLVAGAVAAQSKGNFELLKAGAWKPDLSIADAEVSAAEAQLHSAEIDIERRTIRAPIDGRVLQRKVRPGEFAPAGVLDTPLLVIGNLDALHVRVDIDENDIWRFQSGAPAQAFVRGNRDLHTPLQFVRIEPFVVPKRSLTGDSTERVDTRVMQAIYRFENASLVALVGQQLDVFIEAAPLGTSSRTASRSESRERER